ncbi:hypothetical protein [Dietzia sp. 179-F 9C3 NHS]|uniref:hypothetical protein n=1 Tax=Dietzia sp. 179-F 9C3 NHS TaxID=3374295 RepID=UPI00387949AE
MTRTANEFRPDATATGETGSGRPPVLDLGLMIRAFVASLPLAAVLGVIVGVLVAVILSGIAPTYTTTTTVTVGTPSRAEKDAATMEALGAGMSEFVTDDQVRHFVEAQTGEKVTLSGLFPTVEASTTKIPGVIEIITRSTTGPLAASKMGRVTVDAMNLRANEVRDEFLASVDEATQEQIDDLNEQIKARRRIDPKADTSDLLQMIYDSRAQTQMLRVGYSSASIISQDDGGGEPTWPKPVATGVVGGLVVLLVAATLLAAFRLRRSRRTDVVWARSMGHRHGSEIDVDAAAEDGLPVRSDAAVSGVLSRGGTVVVLGDVDLGTPPLGKGVESARMLVADYDEPWWRDLPVADVALGVVVVDAGGSSTREAEQCLSTFTEVGVPTRLVVRRRGARS